MQTEDILRHYRDRCRDKAPVVIGDDQRTDRGEVDEVALQADGERDFLFVTVKFRIRRHTDR